MSDENLVLRTILKHSLSPHKVFNYFFFVCQKLAVFDFLYSVRNNTSYLVVMKINSFVYSICFFVGESTFDQIKFSGSMIHINFLNSHLFLSLSLSINQTLLSFYFNFIHFVDHVKGHINCVRINVWIMLPMQQFFNREKILYFLQLISLRFLFLSLQFLPRLRMKQKFIIPEFIRRKIDQIVKITYNRGKKKQKKKAD